MIQALVIYFVQLIVTSICQPENRFKLLKLLDKQEKPIRKVEYSD